VLLVGLASLVAGCDNSGIVGPPLSLLNDSHSTVSVSEASPRDGATPTFSHENCNYKTEPGCVVVTERIAPGESARFPLAPKDADQPVELIYRAGGRDRCIFIPPQLVAPAERLTPVLPVLDLRVSDLAAGGC